MKNFIRVGTLLLMAAASLSVACGPAGKTLTYQQTDMDQEIVLQASSAEKTDRSVDSLLFAFRNFQEEMTELRQTFAETIPQAQAQVTIPVQSLINLPDGAKYGTSDGRATIELQRIGDSYIATSRCDSVARQCAIYERQAYRQRSTIDSLNKVIGTLNSKLAKMALESHSNATQSTYTATEKRAHPLFNGRCLSIGVILGSGLTIGGQALWKRFGVGSILRGLMARIQGRT